MSNVRSMYGVFRPWVSIPHNTRNYINVVLLSQRAFLSNNLSHSSRSLLSPFSIALRVCVCISLLKHSLYRIRKIAIPYCLQRGEKRYRRESSFVCLCVCKRWGSPSPFSIHLSMQNVRTYTRTHTHTYKAHLSLSCSVNVCHNLTDYSSSHPNSISWFWSIERDACVLLFCPWYSMHARSLWSDFVIDRLFGISLESMCVTSVRVVQSSRTGKVSFLWNSRE